MPADAEALADLAAFGGAPSTRPTPVAPTGLTPDPEALADIETHAPEPFMSRQARKGFAKEREQPGPVFRSAVGGLTQDVGGTIAETIGRKGYPITGAALGTVASGLTGLAEDTLSAGGAALTAAGGPIARGVGAAGSYIGRQVVRAVPSLADASLLGVRAVAEPTVEGAVRATPALLERVAPTEGRVVAG